MPHGRAILESCGKIGEYLSDGSPSFIAMQLAFPVTDWIETCNDRAFLEHGSARAPPSPFMSLPLEIHRMIFSYLGDYADVFCLSLVDLYFWRIGRAELIHKVLSVLCPLANRALICVGDYTSTEFPDYPAGLLTPDEVEELQAGLDSDDEDEENEVSCTYNGPENLYHLAGARYNYIAKASGPEAICWPDRRFHFMRSGLDELIRLYDRAKGVWRGMTRLSDIAKGNLRAFPEPERSQVLALASPELEHYFPKNKKWVLRNLTTKEFVTADAVALKPNFVEGPLIYGLGFGEVVLSRICWSSDPAVGVSDELLFHKGVWAGHRFDIVTTEKLQMERGEGGGDLWKDVSEEVVKEMETIWRYRLGDEWVRLLYEGRNVALYFSPIAKIPGPKLAALTSWCEFYYDVIKPGQFVWHIKDLHEQYGPILRITPWEIHINDPDFLDEIYAPSFCNREKYSFQTRTLKVPMSMGGTIKHDLHRKRREALDPLFSKKSVTGLESMIRHKVNQLCELMEDHSKQEIVVNLSAVYFAFANDVVSHYSSLPFSDLTIAVKDPTPFPGTGYFSLPSSSGIPSRRQRLVIVESKPRINMLCAALRNHRHLRPGYIFRVMFALDVNAVYESSLLLSLP
ncbi:MAG: cytochrome P450 [Lasallia pustulata]|uniref:Cytochrome P450 n=1 Tax=Lasallia pustulata TaxID=136370 RepID=A0A5M8PAZ5_9LECA|nr:MAG: cytochrome P450 [Lasallia pustulata]